MALQQIVHIAQEAAGRRPSIIEHREYKDALIEGPAVLVPLEEVSFIHSSFDGDPESVFLEVPEGKTVLGVIGLRRVTFTNCEFRNIAIAGTKDAIDQFRAGFTNLGPESQS
jgi:hypothetical protein